MAITEVTKFITEDGKEFTYRPDALAWEDRCNMVESMHGSTSLDRHHCEEAVDWFLATYRVTEKED